MITSDPLMHECLEAVDRRLEPFLHTVVKAENAALTCSGTDVNGPALVEVMRLTSEDTVERIVDGQEGAGALISGVMLRSFWLGYEMRERVGGS